MYHEIDPPEWVPDSGSQLRKTGIYFDAIRIAGERGRQVAALIEPQCAGEPGPVIHEVIGRRWVYFILPPGTVHDFGWPPQAERYSTATPGRIAFIGIPALWGDTWPLFWRCAPNPERPFVDPAMLHAAVVTEANEWNASNGSKT